MCQWAHIQDLLLCTSLLPSQHGALPSLCQTSLGKPSRTFPPALEPHTNCFVQVFVQIKDCVFFCCLHNGKHIRGRVGEKREGKGREGGREGGTGGKREGSVKWRVGLKILKKMPDV